MFHHAAFSEYDDPKFKYVQEARVFSAVTAAGDVAKNIALDYDIDTWDMIDRVLGGDAERGSDEELLADILDLFADVDRPGDFENWLEARIVDAEAILRRRWTQVDLVAILVVEQRRLTREEMWGM